MRKILLSSVAVAALASAFYYTRYMPSYNAIRASNTAAFLDKPDYLPVGVFVGGTSGIGQGMAQAFARATNGNAHIIIIGRNSANAQKIISGFPKPTNPAAKHEFVACDVTLMKNVHSVSQEILSRVPKVNFLVLTTGFFNMGGRDETEEGIDTKLAVHYYSRWAFTEHFLPALVKASDDSEHAKVFSVLSAGRSRGKLDTEDLGLKKTFTVSKAASQGSIYNDLMVMEFAERYPKLSFVYASPGGVRTNLFNSARTAWLRWTGPVVISLLYPFTFSVEESGEHLFYGLLNHGPGAAWIGRKGNTLAPPKFYTEEERKILWEHTEKETLVE